MPILGSLVAAGNRLEEALDRIKALRGRINFVCKEFLRRKNYIDRARNWFTEIANPNNIITKNPTIILVKILNRI